MKKMKISFILAMALVVIFGFSGVALSGGGGPEDPACGTLPEPTRGPFIWGNFTVSLDSGSCSQEFPDCAHYNVHVELRRFGKVHLYSFPATLGTGDLCGYTDSEWKTLFAAVPCTLEVAQDFGLEGVPVIKVLRTTLKEECADNMVKGIIVIRVVPLP